MTLRALLAAGALALGSGGQAPARPGGGADHVSLVQVPFSPRPRAPRPRPLASRALADEGSGPASSLTSSARAGQRLGGSETLETLQQQVEDDALQVTKLHREKEHMVSELEVMKRENEEMVHQVHDLETQLNSSGISEFPDKIDKAKEEGAGSSKTLRALVNKQKGTRAKLEAAQKENQESTEKMLELSSAEASLKLSVHDLALKQKAWSELLGEEKSKSIEKTESLRKQLEEMKSNITRFTEKREVLTNNNQLIKDATVRTETETQTMRDRLKEISKSNLNYLDAPKIELASVKLKEENQVMHSAITKVVALLLPLQ